VDVCHGGSEEIEEEHRDGYSNWSPRWGGAGVLLTLARGGGKIIWKVDMVSSSRPKTPYKRRQGLLPRRRSKKGHVDKPLQGGADSLFRHLWGEETPPPPPGANENDVWIWTGNLPRQFSRKGQGGHAGAPHCRPNRFPRTDSLNPQSYDENR